ncbi:hypothetical protein F4778DRAFT_576271 [Xylariomycetidae sp. FL2044]|nr:hypothetical protein F4778DRAFT_576271 [Xylariomycetidae sp. FL2044]
MSYIIADLWFRTSKDGPAIKPLSVEIGCGQPNHGRKMNILAIFLITGRRQLDIYGTAESEISHTCHWAHCMNLHVLDESHPDNVARKDCYKQARQRHAEGRRIPAFCTRHDPPCRLQMSVTSLISTVIREFSVANRVVVGFQSDEPDDQNHEDEQPWSHISLEQLGKWFPKKSFDNLPTPQVLDDDHELYTTTWSSDGREYSHGTGCIISGKYSAADVGRLLHVNRGQDATGVFLRCLLTWSRGRRLFVPEADDIHGLGHVNSSGGFGPGQNKYKCALCTTRRAKNAPNPTPVVPNGFDDFRLALQHIIKSMGYTLEGSQRSAP